MVYETQVRSRRSNRGVVFFFLILATVGAGGWTLSAKFRETVAAFVRTAGVHRVRTSPFGVADPRLTAPNPTGGPANPFLANGRAIVRGLSAIAARSGRPLRLMNLEADTFTGLTAQVQEPRDHLRVDEYKIAIDGTIAGPTPVSLSGENGNAPTAADVDRNTFDPELFRFAGLSSAVRAAILRSKVADARVSSWQIDRAWGEYQWGLTMDAARSRPNVSLAPDASIKTIGF